MLEQHTAPEDWRRRIVHDWAARTTSADPIEAAAAKELLRKFLGTRHPNGGRERAATWDNAPFWTSVIDLVILGHRNPSNFKTGHDHMHASKSGTCVTVTTSKGVWYCSSPSCRYGGTAIQWVMEREQVGYGEAWDILVVSYGAPRAG